MPLQAPPTQPEATPTQPEAPPTESEASGTSQQPSSPSLPPQSSKLEGKESASGNTGEGGADIEEGVVAPSGGHEGAEGRGQRLATAARQESREEKVERFEIFMANENKQILQRNFH